MIDTLAQFADGLEEIGCDAAAMVRGPYGDFLGKRVAVYGPNFIWRGRLTAVTATELVLEDVYQIRDAADHDLDSCDDMYFAPRMIHSLGAVCNVASPKWA